MSKPYSQACENNKQVILEQLKRVFSAGEQVLEIGSGTAQHLCHFAEQMPTVTWLPSDIRESLQSVVQGLDGAGLGNVKSPIELDVQHQDWTINKVDGVYSANCLHIMSLSAVADFFAGVGKILRPGGYLCVYGPFKYGGKFTSASNAKFQLWLTNRNEHSGIRDFESVNDFAHLADLKLIEDLAMPANNQLIIWQKNLYL